MKILVRVLLLFVIQTNAIVMCGKLFSYNINMNATSIAFGKTECALGIHGNMMFFGAPKEFVNVCANGVIYFGGDAANSRAIPFPVLGKAILAPFWADRTGFNSAEVVPDNQKIFSETILPYTNESAKFNEFVRASNPSNERIRQFTATRTYQITWSKIVYDRSHPEILNSFQTVLLTDEIMYFAIFHYPEGEINWLVSNDETSYPIAGANSGDGISFIHLPFSGSKYNPPFEGSNIGVPGVWVLDIGTILVQPHEQEKDMHIPTQMPGFSLATMVYHNVDHESNNLGFSISTHQNQVLVGQPSCSQAVEHDKPCGKVYLLDIRYRSWDLVQFFPNTGRIPGSMFGANVRLQDKWLLIQSKGKRVSGKESEQSVVYGYQYSVDHDRYIEKFGILPPATRTFIDFGDSFAMDGSHIIVSAKLVGADGHSFSGVALVYQISNLLGPATNAHFLEICLPHKELKGSFQQSVAAKNDILLISTSTYSSSAIYVYTYDSKSATCIQTITPVGDSSFFFGNKIVYTGTDLFVGSYLDSTYGTAVGSVHHFVQNPDGAFYQQEILVSYDQVEYGMFGVSIDYNTDEQLLIIGATVNYRCAPCYNKGAVYALKKTNGGAWEQAKYATGHGDGSDLFGYNVASTSQGIIVGAPYDSTKDSDRGALYLISS